MLMLIQNKVDFHVSLCDIYFVFHVCLYTAQQYASSGSLSTEHVSREEYLKEARKKYFFLDPSVPSFRLFEYYDDNNKYIEEPELWRPTGQNFGSQDKVNI